MRTRLQALGSMAIVVASLMMFAPARVEAAGTAVVSIGDVSVVEGQVTRRYVKFSVTLSEPSATSISVPYATADVSATNGPDYKLRTGTLVFSPGQTAKYFAVTVWPDSLVEGDETFAVTLGAPSGSAVIGDGAGVGTILDDDPSAGPKVSIGDSLVHETCTGSIKPRAVVVVTLSAGQGSPVVVNVASSDASATAGSDYTAYNKTITFSAAQNLKEVKIPVTNDVVVEGSETLTLTLTLLSGPVTLGRSVSTVTLGDCTP